MKIFLAMFVQFCIVFSSIAQDRSLAEGERPLEREQQFLEQRKLADGSFPELWQQFVEGKMKYLGKATSVPSANWVSLGPDGTDSTSGRMTCYAFNPFNPQVIIAGAASGGVWKSFDGGDTWRVLSDDLPSLWISAVAFNPTDTNHILIGTGFYMTNSISVQPGIGVLESFDGGHSWMPNSFSYPFSAGVSVNRIMWDSHNKNNIYLACSNGLWVSRNLGMSWSGSLAGLISDLDIVSTATNILYASVHSDGIYKSIDSGGTWVMLSNGLPGSATVHRITLDVCDSFPQFIIASIINPTNWGLNGVYKTSDGGSSWTLMTGIPNFTGVTSTIHLGWYVNMVEISPMDTNLIFLGSGKLFRTNNGGISWVQKDYYLTGGQSVGIVHPDQWDLGFQPDNPSVVYSFNDGGVNKSFDSGSFWQLKNGNLVTAQVYRFSSFPGDTVRIIAGIQDNGLTYLDNTGGNLNWKNWRMGDGCAVAYDPNNPVKVYGDLVNGDHRRNSNVASGVSSTVNFNSGITGTNSNPFHFVLVHHPTLSNVLYTSNDTKIFKSTNGTSWAGIATIANVKAIAISEHTPSTVYAAAFDWNNTSTHSFYVSFDDGANWMPSATSPGWRVTDIEADPNNYGTVYATRNSAFAANPHVYKSIDHGNSWIAINSGLPDVSTNAITVNPYNPKVVYVATDLGVYISQDAGNSWTDYNDNLPPYYVMDMHYHKMDSTLRTATLGRGVWKTKSIPSDFAGIDMTAIILPDSVGVFPNPFNSQVSIEMNVPESSDYVISVINSLGQVVKLLHKGVLHKGKMVLKWNGDNLAGKNCSDGNYFLEIKNKSLKRTFRIVKSN